MLAGHSKKKRQSRQSQNTSHRSRPRKKSSTARYIRGQQSIATKYNRRKGTLQTYTLTTQNRYRKDPEETGGFKKLQLWNPAPRYPPIKRLLKPKIIHISLFTLRHSQSKAQNLNLLEMPTSILQYIPNFISINLGLFKNYKQNLDYR